MSYRSIRIRLVWPVAITALLASTVALADDNDPRVIEQRLSALESNPERKQLIAEPTASARKALERVRNAHAAGDVPFGLELSALAKDYADLATDLLRATELEKELAKVQTQLSEVAQKRRRTETLLEETFAQRERTKQELLRLQASKAEAATKPATTKPAATKPAATKPAAADKKVAQ